MLQASCDLLEAARKGQLQRVKALLLSGADPGARTSDVSYSSSICIFGNDTAYTVCETLILNNTFTSNAFVIP